LHALFPDDSLALQEYIFQVAGLWHPVGVDLSPAHLGVPML